MNIDIEEETNFFDSGASSADLTRLIEEINTLFKVVIYNCEVNLTLLKKIFFVFRLIKILLLKNFYIWL